MENWLVRSGMNVQRQSNFEARHTGRRTDTLAIRDIHSYQSNSRGHTRGGRPTRARRERCALLSEQLEVTDLECLQLNFNYYDKAENNSAQQPCCDGYLNSAKLLVLPGSRETEVSEDRLSNWDSLVLAIQLIHEDLACPICLYPPVFSRMERCGHVYCGPCAVQYINHDNESSTKKCAVCTWILRLEDLKRVKLVNVSPLKVGCSVDLSLLVRSLVKPDAHPIVPIKAGSPSTNYQFIQETTSEDTKSLISEEIHALEAYKSICIEEGNVELVPYISYLISHDESELKEFLSRENSNDHQLAALTLEQHEPLDETGPSSSAVDAVYFYQASDGQLVFLDGLMWKCLLTEYNSVSNLPSTLSVTVSGVKTFKMNHMLRKRWRHLSHVPLGRNFSMIEIELEPHVSEETLRRFSSALTVRQTERARRQLEDMRLTQLKEAAENRIPMLPEGFRLSGHAELSDQRTPPDPSEFVPLCTATSVQRKPTTSFAEVTKMGARSVVNEHRIATFTRGSVTNRQTAKFNPSTEFWPSLGEQTKMQNPEQGQPAHCTGPWRLSSAREPSQLLDSNEAVTTNKSISYARSVKK